MKKIGKMMRTTDATASRRRPETGNRRDYFALFEANPLPMWIIDPSNFRFLNVNRAAIAKYGYSRSQFSLLSMKDIVEEVEFPEYILRADKEGPDNYRPWKHKKKDGEIIEVEVLLQDVRLKGKPAKLLVLNDITERLRAERALLASEERFSKAFYSSPVAICMSRLDNGVFIDGNEKFLEMTGYAHSDLVGRTLLDLAIWPAEQERKCFVENLLQERTNKQFEGKYRTKQDELRQCLISVEIVGLADCAGLLMMMDDITEAKKNQEKIRSYQEELRSLASKLSVAEELERRRIAALLHDHVGQNLAMLKIKLGGLQSSVRGARIRGEINRLRALLEETLTSARSLSFELSPPVLYEVGFEAAIEWLSERTQEEHGIRVEFSDDGRRKELSDPLKVVLFTAVRELFVNIVKHSRAGEASVSIKRHENQIVITVQDNGIGFDPFGIDPAAGLRGFGLFSVRERISHMGGTVTIASKRNCGTRILLSAPLVMTSEIRRA